VRDTFRIGFAQGGDGKRQRGLVEHEGPRRIDAGFCGEPPLARRSLGALGGGRLLRRRLSLCGDLSGRRLFLRRRRGFARAG
jgi:hypothetical protein